MADPLVQLRHQIKNTDDLRSVVRTMKAMSAAVITQFDQAVTALLEYDRTVELALSVCLRNTLPSATFESLGDGGHQREGGMIVFGSDQGLAGQFNEHVSDAARARGAGEPRFPKLWVVGQRVEARLEDAGQTVQRCFATPQSVEAIAPLVSDLLFEIESSYTKGEVCEINLCHNSPLTHSNYQTTWTRLLPLDRSWRDDIAKVPWPEAPLPEMIDCGQASQTSLIGEYLFVSLFRACAESCAAENAARLAAMQRAEKNLDDRRNSLDLEYNHQRKSAIDEELFDLISGFEVLSGDETRSTETDP